MDRQKKVKKQEPGQKNKHYYSFLLGVLTISVNRILVFLHFPLTAASSEIYLMTGPPKAELKIKSDNKNIFLMTEHGKNAEYII